MTSPSIFMRYLQIIFRGIGQVMFQNNIYSGILFLIGIFYNSWALGLAALLGTIISTGSAQILKYPKEEIQNGLYGFNGTLTGIAVFCFFEITFTTVIALLIGASLSTLIMRYLMKITSPFTAPFVMTTWFVIYTLVFLFNVPLLLSSGSTRPAMDLLSATSNSFGQVMFQENVITGLIFLFGIFINNKIMAIVAIYAAVLGSFTGWFFSESTAAINGGLMGYNAILCAIALAGRRRIDFLWISIAIILSTLLTIGMATTGIMVLTAPFVLVTWGVLKSKKIKILKSGKTLT